MVPLVSADINGMVTTQLSAGLVRMKGRHTARAHRHDDTDVIVLLWKAGKAGVLTLYGDGLDQEIWQQPHQALWIPRGVPHAAINPSRYVSVVAWEFRSNPILGEDNQLMPDLERVVNARRYVLTRRGRRARMRHLGDALARHVQRAA